MADSKKIVIVGIPGVGKTSLVTRLVELIRQKNKSVSVHSYGTIMLEEAKKTGVEDRDELRMLPIEKQKKLQKTAAEMISNLTDDVIFIDTHAFISTKAGFYPGLPNYVIQSYNLHISSQLLPALMKYIIEESRTKQETEMLFRLKTLKKNLLFRMPCFLAVLSFQVHP